MGLTSSGLTFHVVCVVTKLCVDLDYRVECAVLEVSSEVRQWLLASAFRKFGGIQPRTPA
jgi:hypothetical protein